MAERVPYLLGVRVLSERMPPVLEHPFKLPFLPVLQNRVGQGIFLLDEPESALSPQRQLALLALMHDLVERGESQFIVATHSPILMTYPGAQIVSFDQVPLRTISLAETSHYQITRGILAEPDRYWRYLAGS